MKIGFILCCYNRPVELQYCLESLLGTNHPENMMAIVIDDCSADCDTINQIAEFQWPGVQVIKIRQPRNTGIRQALKTGCDLCFSSGCDLVINLDADAIVKPNFFTKLIELKTRVGANMVTGFHSVNKNLNGTDRHPIIATYDDYVLKSSVGGINLCFDAANYKSCIEPQLNRVGNWDYHACIAAMEINQPIACTVPSVVQHQATKSSMGHAEEPDVACDFVSLYLPEVTLIGADCNHFTQLEAAARISTKDIQFGAVKLLTSKETNNPNAVRIPHIGTKEGYSEFCVRELYKYVDTPYLLIIQGDGYVLNWRAWTNGFLCNDYIGATWWFKDRRNVGNGGFSLRSRIFHEIIANEPDIINTYPEDEKLCRVYRPMLEAKYKLKWATEDLANLFSIEAYQSADRKYSGQFGFHGYGIDFSEARLPHKPTTNETRTIPGRRRLR